MPVSFGIIYKVTNLINNKCYIGKTSITLEKRKWQHINDSKIKRYNSIFHNALRKYGIENFKWEVLCECDNNDMLNIRETMKIIVEHSHVSECGYNMTYGGDGLPVGYKHTEESIQRMSDFQKGRKKSEEHKQKIGSSNKGKKRSEDAKQRNRIAHLGKITSETTKQKISNSHKNRIMSDEEKQKRIHALKNRIITDETRQKWSIAAKNISDETRKRRSDALKGRMISDETRKKMSESAKKRKRRRKFVYK